MEAKDFLEKKIKEDFNIGLVFKTKGEFDKNHIARLMTLYSETLHFQKDDVVSFEGKTCYVLYSCEGWVDLSVKGTRDIIEGVKVTLLKK